MYTNVMIQNKHNEDLLVITYKNYIIEYVTIILTKLNYRTLHGIRLKNKQ